MPRARGRNRRALARALDAKAVARERAFRQLALVMFGREREDIVRILSAAAERGDKYVAAAVRRIAYAYTAADGKYHEQWLRRYTELITQTVRASAVDLVGMDFSLRNPRVLAAIRRRAEGLADQIGRASASRVSRAVSRAYDAGEGVGSVVKAIRDDAFGERISLSRAQTIARTETVGSINEGEYTAATAADVFVEKEWISQGDDRVRDTHVELDGVRIGIDDRFANGLLHPGEQGGDPAEVINCRCTLLYYS